MSDLLDEFRRHGAEIREGSRRAIEIEQELDELERRIDRAAAESRSAVDRVSRRRAARRLEAAETRWERLVNQKEALLLPSPDRYCNCGQPVYDEFTSAVCTTCRRLFTGT